MTRQIMWPSICNEVTWRLRRRITTLNKAKAGAAIRPNGMTRLVLEDIDQEMSVIRSELRARQDEQATR